MITFPKTKNREIAKSKTIQPATKGHQGERKALQESKKERLWEDGRDWRQFALSTQ